MRFNSMLLILSIALHIVTSSTTASTECDNALSNNKSDDQYELTNQASVEDVTWANDLAKNSLEMVWQNLQDKFQQQEMLGTVNKGVI